MRVSNRALTTHSAKDAMTDLLVLLEAVEGLVDFPPQHVEHARWDSFEKLSCMSYRETPGRPPELEILTQ